MEPEAATLLGKFIGAGLAAIAMGGAATCVGHIAGSYLSGALRNPAAAKDQLGMFFIGIALAEALGLFALVISLLLLFVF